MMMTIFVNQLSLPLVIGVYSEERQAPQEILCDIECDIEVKKISDDINDTLNYADLADQLVAASATTQFQLLETLADFLLKEIFEFYPVTRAKATLTKANALVIPKATGCGVVLERLAEQS